jgi:hypothetical protein
VGGSGAGGAGTDDGWVAGNNDDDSIDGYVQSSTCTVSHDRRSGLGFWLVLGVVGVGAALRRRLRILLER